MNIIQTNVRFFWVRQVKTKKILRFYFSADSLDSAFDNLIMRIACGADGDAERLCGVIGERILLAELWAYLDGILSPFTSSERAALCEYASRGAASEGTRRDAKSAVNKFTRRARRLGGFHEGIAVLDRYYCLIRGATV